MTTELPVALVIEDDADIAELLRTVLSRVGFSVLTAENGLEGAALALRHRPVLATVDVAMPGMDGLEATQRIREFSDAYIVIISTRSQEQDILAGFAAGADDYVPKPIRPRELEARLAAVARRGPQGRTEGWAAGWAPADVDPERSAYHHRVLAGVSPSAATVGLGAEVAPEDPTDTIDGAEGGQDGREGMLELGMRFVGSWIEFAGLRINPARGLVVVDDRLVDLPQELVDLLEVLLYSGSLTLSPRDLVLRLRGDTGENAYATGQDLRWIETLVTRLLNGLGDNQARRRWIETLPGPRYRLVRAEMA